MFGSIKDMRGLEVVARDGSIGHLRTLFFEEDDWMTHALAVTPADRPGAREVFVPPGAVTRVDPARGRIELGVTRRQLEQAGNAEAPAGLHLHSSVDFIDSLVVATDGAIGHVDDLLLDARNGQIRFAAVDTHRWRPDRRVLIRTSWLHDIDALRRQVRVMVGGAVVKACPSYAPPAHEAETAMTPAFAADARGARAAQS